MNILQKLFQGKCIPVSEHGGNSSCEYEVAVEKLCKIAENLRQYGVPEELISALDKAENEILALEEKRMFRFAIRYRAELQRELMRKGQAIAACPFRYYAVFFFRSCSSGVFSLAGITITFLSGLVSTMSLSLHPLVVFQPYFDLFTDICNLPDALPQ